MRIAVLVAGSVLLAGCSQATVSDPEPTPPSTSTSALAPTSGATTATTTAPPSSPPEPGAAVSQVIAWIEAGQPADTAQYHTATRDGVSSDLGDDVAFTTGSTSSGAATCMTDTRYAEGALACLVDLTDPPPRPTTVYGHWKGNWVDFDGSGLQVGSAHGDPGPFSYGDGPELADGATLAFGDYRCRADRAGLFCVNYAHRSAARFSAEGIDAFGCLHPVPPPEGAGKMFSC